MRWTRELALVAALAALTSASADSIFAQVVDVTGISTEAVQLADAYITAARAVSTPPGTPAFSPPPPIASPPPTIPPPLKSPPPATPPLGGGVWTVDYGGDCCLNTSSTPNGPVTFKLHMDSTWQYDGPNCFLTNTGARIRFGPPASSGHFCVDAKTAPGNNPGSIFAIYVTSGEPVNRDTDSWDELDMELLGKTPDSMWLNYYHNGYANQDPNPVNKPMGFTANGAFHTYCLDWDLPSAKATWTLDGVLFNSLTLTGWTKPMFPMISYWGMNHPWSGRIMVTGDIYSTVQNYKYTVRS